MNLRFNHRDFFDKEEIKEISGMLKSHTITIDHVRAYIAVSILDLYNDLYNSMCNLCRVESLTADDAIRRDNIAAWLENESETWHRWKTYECFNACKENGLIGICGRGYTFDRGRITDAEISRLASEMAVALILAA